MKKSTKHLPRESLGDSYNSALRSNGQTYGGDFEKFCGLLRVYELYYNLVSTINGLGLFTASRNNIRENC